MHWRVPVQSTRHSLAASLHELVHGKRLLEVGFQVVKAGESEDKKSRVCHAVLEHRKAGRSEQSKPLISTALLESSLLERHICFV